MNPKIGDDWMLRGQQKEVLTPGQNVKRYLARALNARTGRLTWVEAPRKTSSLFVWLVDQLVQRAYGRAERIHWVLDNFRIQSSRVVEAARTGQYDRVRNTNAWALACLWAGAAANTVETEPRGGGYQAARRTILDRR